MDDGDPKGTLLSLYYCFKFSVCHGLVSAEVSLWITLFEEAVESVQERGMRWIIRMVVIAFSVFPDLV